MDKSVVVTVERQVRHELYGKTAAADVAFMAHDEKNDAKVGDRVALVASRPLSRAQALGRDARRREGEGESQP